MKSLVFSLYRTHSEGLIVGGLILITLLVLAVSINYSKAMFFVDPYTFFAKALQISQGAGWTFNPYILFISLFIKIYPYSEGLLLFSRIMNLLFAVQLVTVAYLVARRLFNQIFSFFTGLTVLFLPLVHAYSLQLHNDIFTAAMGLTAIFLISKPTLRNVLLAVPFVILACATRPDYSIIFSLPFGLILARYYTRDMPFRSKLLASLMVIALVLGIGYLIFQGFYLSTTRFGVLERIFIFLNYDVIVIVWKNLILVTTNDTLNIAFGAMTCAGVLLLIPANYKSIFKMITLKHFMPTESEITGIFLTICFFISLFGVIVFHTTYTIVDDKIIINPKITPRYLIPVQLFFTFGFVYAFSNLNWNNIIQIRSLITSVSSSKTKTAVSGSKS